MAASCRMLLGAVFGATRWAFCAWAANSHADYLLAHAISAKVLAHLSSRELLALVNKDNPLFTDTLSGITFENFAAPRDALLEGGGGHRLLCALRTGT